MKQRILIAEDHTILREGLRALLSSAHDLEIAGEAVNGREAMQAANTLRPDLVLMDLSMPGTNGIDAIIGIKKRFPSMRILTLTVHKTEEYIREALKAGTDGYVLKEACHHELMTAIRTVLNGRIYLSPGISEWVIISPQDRDKASSVNTVWDTITRREREILKLIGEGSTNKHIAIYLSVSVKTVEKHRSNLMKKLNLHNASGITAFAIEKGLIVR